jgi:hypothetical protein
MRAKRFKASIEPGTPPKGTLKGVVSFKDNSGGRWEFVGVLPLEAGKIMMALCVTKGKQQSLITGSDSGIEQAWRMP